MRNPLKKDSPEFKDRMKKLKAAGSRPNKRIERKLDNGQNTPSSS